MSFHIIELPFIVIPVLLAIVFWLWMLRDCLYNTSLRGTYKFLWLLVIFFAHLIGAIAYFIIERSKTQG